MESFYLNVSNSMLMEDKMFFLMPRPDTVLTVTVHMAADVKFQDRTNVFGYFFF